MVILVQYTAATAKASGSTWRGVRCEHCGTRYVFRHEVSVKFTEVELYSRGSPAQRKRAEAGARARLEYHLKRKVEPVPCPSCHLLQDDMCEDVRQRRYGWMYTAGMFMVAAAVMGVAAPIALLTDTDQTHTFNEVTIATVIAAVACILPAATFGLKRWLWKGYDPNVQNRKDGRITVAAKRAMTRTEFDRQHPDTDVYEAKGAYPKAG